MTPNFKVDRPTIAVGITLGLVLLLAFYWMLQFWLLRSDFGAEIESIQPRTARLLGIAESFDQLRLASSGAEAILQDVTYSADRDSPTTAAAMQRDIRELLVNAGLSVSGSQILPARKSADFDRLSLDITAQGNIDELDQAFAGIQALRPLVFVESVDLKPVAARRSRRAKVEEDGAAEGDPRKLTARFQLFSLRLTE
ncbi:MAG: type II secretion system protein GspM [Halioglobus sp.]|nr:type II secretion system protein GspM [Halioglobus sp.]